MSVTFPTMHDESVQDSFYNNNNNNDDDSMYDNSNNSNDKSDPYKLFQEELIKLIIDGNCDGVRNILIRRQSNYSLDFCYDKNQQRPNETYWDYDRRSQCWLCSPLIVATHCFPSLENVSLLLEYGAKVDYTPCHETEPKLWSTALAESCIPPYLQPVLSLNVNITDLLLRYGANPNAKCSATGATPLIFACCHGYYEAAKLLLASGVDPTLTDKNNNQPIHWSIGSSFFIPCTMALIIDVTPHVVNQVEHGGITTPIQNALISLRYPNDNHDDNWQYEYPENIRCEMIRLILQKDRTLVDFQFRNNPSEADHVVMGDTPLHVALRNDRHQVLHCLLEYYPDVNITNNEGVNALQLAQHLNRMDDLVAIKQMIKTYQNRCNMMQYFLGWMGDDFDASF